MAPSLTFQVPRSSSGPLEHGGRQEWVGPSSSLVSRCQGSWWPFPPPRPSQAVFRCGAADELCPRPSPEAHPSGRCWACKFLRPAIMQEKANSQHPWRGQVAARSGCVMVRRERQACGKSRKQVYTASVAVGSGPRSARRPCGPGPFVLVLSPQPPPLPRMANYPPTCQPPSRPWVTWPHVRGSRL